jgi:hypothetical protein
MARVVEHQAALLLELHPQVPAKRFFTPSGAEMCFSIFAERDDLKSHA